MLALALSACGGESKCNESCEDASDCVGSLICHGGRCMPAECKSCPMTCNVGASDESGRCDFVGCR